MVSFKHHPESRALTPEDKVSSDLEFIFNCDYDDFVGIFIHFCRLAAVADRRPADSN